MFNIKNKLLNHLMNGGKKQTSEKIVLKSSKALQKTKRKKNFKEILKLALVNVSPVLIIKTIKRKKKNVIKFPLLIAAPLKFSCGIKSILKSSEIKIPLSFYKKLNLELINVSKLEGTSVEKKKETYKSAFLEKKYAHYRWFI